MFRNVGEPAINSLCSLFPRISITIIHPALRCRSLLMIVSAAVALSACSSSSGKSDAGGGNGGSGGVSGSGGSSGKGGSPDGGGALLINGSFEARVVTAADNCQGFAWCVRSSDSTPGWTQILDGVDLINNSYAQGPAVLVQAADGVNWLDMNQAGVLGGIEQVVAANVGTTYQLTLDTCAWAANSVPGTIGYQLYDPGTMTVLANDMYTDSVGGTWITEQIQAAATSASIGVRIQGLAAHQAGMGLDNVRLEAVASLPGG